MKIFKRNAVIITVLLFVAVAVYLNWSYNRGQDLAADRPVATDRLSGPEADAEDALRGEEEREQDGEREDQGTESLYFFGPRETTTMLSAAAISYFDSARLTREQARDSATSLLQEAASISTASQTEIDSALAAITAMATFALQEAQLENILMAKDIERAVVFIRNEGVSVIVSAPPVGLSEVAVARITETVISELGISAEQLVIIPVT